MHGSRGGRLHSPPAIFVKKVAEALLTAAVKRFRVVPRTVRSAFLAILLIIAPLFAQATQSFNVQGVIRITVSLVQVDAVVTDSEGRQVANLKPDEFEIFEDGHRQTITNFSYISLAATSEGTVPARPAQPGVPYLPPARLRPEQVRRTIVVLVDDLHIRFENLELARRALRKFVDDDLHPSDLVAILHTSGGLGVLQQFTNDKRILGEAIDRIHYRVSTPCGLFGMQTDLPPELRRYCSRVTNVATFESLVYVLKGLRDLPGRKAVIVLSDELLVSPPSGVGPLLDARESSARTGRSASQQNHDLAGEPPSAQAMLRELADLANRSSAVLYAIDTMGLPTLQLNASDDLTGLPPIWGGPSSVEPAPRQVANHLASLRMGYLGSQFSMSFLANQTGGIFIHDNNDLAGGMRDIMDDLRGYYLIGYKPPADTFKEGERAGYHRIEVKVKVPGLHVRSRAGFFGVADRETRLVQLTPVEQLRAAAVSPFGASGIHVEIAPQFLYHGDKDSMARLWLHVDGPDVTLQDQPGGKEMGTVDLLALAFGDNGEVAGDVGGAFHTSLQPDQLDTFRTQGVNYHFDVPIHEPGGYQLRVAVRDPVSQKVGSASQFIEIPDLRKGRLALSGIVLNPEALGDAGPAVRRFRPGDRVKFELEVYNARRAKGRQAHDIEATLRIFRGGRLVSTQTGGTAVDVPWDSHRVVISGVIGLGPAIGPGHYILQATVTDKLAPKKNSKASQWVDFEVEPPEGASLGR